MSEELVSVVIVAYNSWPDVARAIESALDQTHGAIEVIVVDNSSIDATPREVPRRYGSRVKYLCQENRGDGSGYNAGFDASSGRFVQFMDGDDYLAPDKVERQLAAFMADPEANIVYGDVRRFAGDATWSDWSCADEPDMLAALLAEDGRGGGLTVHSVLFSRRALERVGRWDETLYVTDVDYWFRAASAGCRFRYCPGSLCFYQHRPGQMSADPEAMGLGMEAVWQKALSYVEAEPYRTLVATRLARFRYARALSGPGTARDRMERLLLARGTSSSAISLPAYLAARLLIALPGGRALSRSAAWKPVRGFAAQMLGMK